MSSNDLNKMELHEMSKADQTQIGGGLSSLPLSLLVYLLAKGGGSLPALT